MDDDDAFRRRIRADLHDDLPRLAYADWLDEQGDPNRAAYLRVECELRRTWSYKTPRKMLFRRLAALRRRVDRGWLADARRCTSPPPPADVATAVPELKRMARTAVVLHSRPGEDDRDASKLGGTFLWPRRRPWPLCSDHGCPLVPALQLRKEDVPEVAFKRGADLLQLLWCPRDHGPTFCPAVEAFWWKRAAVRDPVDPPPPGPDAETHYLPTPCRLYPERVVEYPDPFELADDVKGRIDASAALAEAVARVGREIKDGWGLPDGPMDLYQFWLSTADGTKVGGYPDWVQYEEYPTCECGTVMPLLVMFSSHEFDGGTWGRWVPVQERDVLTGKPEERRAVQRAAGLMIGDAGNLYVFMCRRCPGRPIRWSSQCS